MSEQEQKAREKQLKDVKDSVLSIGIVIAVIFAAVYGKTSGIVAVVLIAFIVWFVRFNLEQLQKRIFPGVKDDWPESLLFFFSIMLLVGAILGIALYQMFFSSY